MSDTTEKLCERLLKEIRVYNGRGTFRSERVNPDGPEAAAELTRLTTELAGLREALRLIEFYSDSEYAQETARAALNERNSHE